MTVSQSYLFKNYLEFVPIDRIKEDVPNSIRGLYVLYHSPDGKKTMNVVYIGMARGENIAGIKSRLVRHASSKRKVGLWTHCSVFEVWHNITKSQVEELEALFRHVYSKNNTANVLNKQKTSSLFLNIRRTSKDWLYTEPRDTKE